MAIIDTPKVIMRVANIKCIKFVEKGDRLIAKAEIYRNVDKEHYVKVVINNKKQEQIFRGKFIFEEIKFVEKGDRLIAKAEIYRNVDKEHYVKVVINNKKQEQIFRGKFIFEEME